MYIRTYFALISTMWITACNIQNILPAEEQSGSYEVTQKRANEAYDNNNFETAEEEYLSLTLSTADDPELWFRLGNSDARSNKLDKAVNAYHEALALDPEDSKILNNLGIVQLRQATNTFAEMLQYAQEDDPLKLRAEQVINTITQLIDRI